jgi:hypothetical protein
MPIIALVDDDRNIHTSVSIAFEAEGYRIMTYSDGASALGPQCDQRQTKTGEIGRPKPQHAVEQKGRRASRAESVSLIENPRHQVSAQRVESECRDVRSPRLPNGQRCVCATINARM